jgi:hypothetical protein
VSVPSGDNNSDANVNGPSAIPKLPALPQWSKFLLFNGETNFTFFYQKPIFINPLYWDYFNLRPLRS